MSAEIPLDGGNASGAVVRVGDTVRKPWTSTTPLVHAYLERLALAGIEVPTPLGRDAQGRQVLQFVPGRMADFATALDPGTLARIGALVRSIHDASATLPHSMLEDPRWDPLLPTPGGERDLMCHGDLAPWNLVVGTRLVFIDWDGSGPSTRLWDLAYSAQAFARLVADEPVPSSCERLVAFIEGYGAERALREALVDTMADRTDAMYRLLRLSSESGRQPWAQMYADGHGAHWDAARRYVRQHRDAWRRALRV